MNAALIPYLVPKSIRPLLHSTHRFCSELLLLQSVSAISTAAAMGKASRWFRGLLGLKISTDSSQSQVQKQSSSKKKWSFVKSRKQKPDLLQKPRNDVVNDDHEASNHAMAMAAATAAVAEAAVAAAQAAAAVVHLTSSGRNISVATGIVDDEEVGVAAAACVSRSEAGCRSREERAAVTIQSHFRAYLSRRALRALKALVRLQALVRGHLVRKQTTYVLQRLQALVRAQVRARAGRVVSESPHSSIKLSHFNNPGPATPEKFDHVLQSRSLKQEQLAMLKINGSKSSRNTNNSSEKSFVNYICTDSGMDERLWEQRSCTRPLTTDNYQTDKVLEIDTGKPQVVPKNKSIVYSNLTRGSDSNYASFSASKDSTARQPVLSQCGTPKSLSHPLNLEKDVIGSAYCTADNSPTFYSASSMGSSKRGAFTPTSSDCSRSCLSGYSDHPNYMAYTESSKAKVRSHSAPKLRSQFERSSSTKKYSVHTYGDSRSTQRGSLLHANFTNKAYPGSGRLDRLGIHARADIAGITGGNWH